MFLTRPSARIRILASVRHHWYSFRQQVKAVRQRGAFSQDVTFVFGGKAITLVIGVVFTPILARIYSQEAFGTFGLLNNIITTGAICVGLKLSEAFILPPSETQFQSLTRVTWWISRWVSILAAVIMFLLGGWIFELIHVEVPWIVRLVLPLMMLLYSAEEHQVNWVRRVKAFRAVSFIDPSSQAASRLFALLYGLVSPTWWGLLLKEVLRILMNMVLRWRMILAPYGLRAYVSVPAGREIRAVFKRYWRLPAFRVPSMFVGTFANGLPAYLVANRYGVVAVGDMLQAITLLYYPLYLFANTFDSVFQQKATELRQRSHQALVSGTMRLYTVLLLLGSLIFGVFYWYGEHLFTIFLGAKWERAGAIASVFAPMFLMRMIGSPLLGLRLVLNKQVWDLVYNVLSAVVTWAVFSYAIATGHDLLGSLAWMSWALAGLYFMSALTVLASLRVYPHVVVPITLVVIALGAAISWLPSLLF